MQNNRRRRGNNGRAHTPAPVHAPVNGLQGAPLPLKDMFVSRVQAGDMNTINEFLANNDIHVLNNEKVSHDGAIYKSFKITISLFDKK